MKAVVLIKAPAGSEIKALRELPSLVGSVEGVTVNDTLYTFGRFDAVISLSASDTGKIVSFVEQIRQKGNFVTETLLGAE